MNATLAPAPAQPVTTPALRVCARCVMDTSDPDITFDADGRATADLTDQLEVIAEYLAQ